MHIFFLGFAYITMNFPAAETGESSKRHDRDGNYQGEADQAENEGDANVDDRMAFDSCDEIDDCSDPSEDESNVSVKV